MVSLRCIVRRHDWQRVRVADVAVIPTVGLCTGYERAADGDRVICWRCGKRDRRQRLEDT